MKIQQILLAAAVVLSGTVALAQDSGDPTTDEMAPKDDPYMDAAPADTPAQPAQMLPPAPAPVEVDVDVNTAPAAQTAVAAPSSTFLGDFGRRDKFGGAIAEVKVGVGGGDYTEDNIQNQTSAGPSWDVRGVFGGHTPIGVEAAYVGSSRNVDNPAGAIGDTQLVSNGLEGDLRLALPIKAGEILDIRPFAFGGVGWQYMSFWGDGSVDRANRAADPGDHIMTIPAGLGLDVGIGPLNLEARGTYRHAIGSDLFGDAGSQFDDPNALHSWNVGGSVGVEF